MKIPFLFMKLCLFLSFIISPVYNGRIYEYVEDNAEILSEDTIEELNTLNDLAKRSNKGYVKTITLPEYSNENVLLEDKAIALIYYLDIDSFIILYGRDAQKYLNRNRMDEIIEENKSDDIEFSIKMIVPSLLTEMVESYPSQKNEEPKTMMEKIKYFFSHLFSKNEKVEEGKKMTFIDQLEYYLNTPDGQSVMSLITFSITTLMFVYFIKKRIG